MSRVLALLRATADIRDAHIYGGLLVAAVGGWQLSPPVTLIALGLVLTSFGILGPRLTKGS